MITRLVLPPFHLWPNKTFHRKVKPRAKWEKVSRHRREELEKWSFRKRRRGGEKEAAIDWDDAGIGWFSSREQLPLGGKTNKLRLRRSPKPRLHCSTLAAAPPSSPAHSNSQRRISTDRAAHREKSLDAESLWRLCDSYLSLSKGFINILIDC